jgi:HAD superfamily phosphoserine phosphatase-like hydrolase
MKVQPSRIIVASDLEGTLTTGETWKGFAQYFERNGKSRAYRNFFNSRFPMALLARAGFNRREFQNRWIADLLGLFGGTYYGEFLAAAEWVVENELWDKRRKNVLAVLETCKSEGARVILASGTYQPVLEVFAKRCSPNLGGFEVIGTKLEMVTGKLTGKISGEVNVGKVKAASLLAAIRSEPLEAAFGDTMPDLPMLEMARNPVVIPSDPKLERLALKRGWQIIR